MERIMAISGHVNGFVCFAQFMHPVYSLCMTLVFGTSTKPSDLKKPGANVRATTSIGRKALTRAITVSTRRRPIPRRRKALLTASDCTSTDAAFASPSSGCIW